MKNLAAYTDLGSYPAYVSINETSNGRIGFSVREPAGTMLWKGETVPCEGNYAHVTFPPEVALELLEKAAANLRTLMAHKVQRKA